MATFLEAQTRLLREVNRPSSETSVLASVKDAINDAILQLQRSRTWMYTEGLSSVYTYPTSTATVATLTATGSVLRGLLSVQQLSAAADNMGKPLKIMTYRQLMEKLNTIQRRYPAEWYEQFQSVLDAEGYCTDKILFLTGMNLGLWPMPTSGPVYLKFQYYSWLPVLSLDADTNFFLTYAWDVVNALALKKMCFVLKTTSNYLPTDAEFEKTLKALEMWDDTLAATPHFSPA